MIEATQIALGGVLQGCLYALLAVGFSVVYRVTGVINLAQGAFCVLGALLCDTLEVRWGWPLGVAVLAATAGAALLGAGLAAVAFVPGMRRLSDSNMLMLTAGLLSAVTGALLLGWGPQPYALPSFSGEHPVAVGAVLVPSQGFWVAGVTVTVAAALWLLLQRTPIGRALRACGENPQAAALMGISVPGMTLFSYVLSAAIGALAGIVVAPATSLQFDSGNPFTIYGFIAVAIGGLGSFPGAIAGGLLLGIASQLAAAYVSSLFSSALALGLLLVVLLWRPSGLFSAGRARRGDVREEPRLHRRVVRLTRRQAVAAGVVALALALALPALLPAGGLLGSAVVTIILFVAVIGLDVLMGYGGQVSLGQAGFMAIGGYTAGYLAVQYDVPPLLGLLAGAALSLAASLVLALITMRLRGFYLALATLAFGLLVDSLAVGLDDITGGPSGLVGIPSFAVGGFDFGTPERMYYLVLGLAVVLVVMLSGVLNSRFGRALQAIRTDQTAAAALGIDVPLHKLAAFAISAVLASVAGSLYAFDFNFLAPEMVSTTRSLELVTMMVIGGEATLAGTLPGVALLTLLPTAFGDLASYKTLATGVLLAAFFLYLPEGISGGLVRLSGAAAHLLHGRAPAPARLRRRA